MSNVFAQKKSLSEPSFKYTGLARQRTTGEKRYSSTTCIGYSVIFKKKVDMGKSETIRDPGNYLSNRIIFFCDFFCISFWSSVCCPLKLIISSFF